MGQAKRRKDAGEYPVLDGAKVPHERHHPRARPSCAMCHGTGYCGWTRDNPDRALARLECSCTNRAMRPKPNLREQVARTARFIASFLPKHRRGK